MDTCQHALNAPDADTGTAPDLLPQVGCRSLLLSEGHLSDSLSNSGPPLLRLAAALDELENVQVRGDVREAIVVQSGAVGRASVRLQVKENRKLSPAEVAQLVDAYQAGTSQVELARWFDFHEQTVRAHLGRQGVSLRPLRALTEAQEVEVVRLYVEETWSLAELAGRFGVGQTAVRGVLVRRGVERRARKRRPVRP